MLIGRQRSDVYLPGSWKNCDRDFEARQYGVDQPALLPAGVVLAPQRDEEVIGRDFADDVVERRERIVCAEPPARGRAGVVELSQDRPQALVRAFSGLVRVRYQPLKPSW